ncbi:hypothetical protein ACWA7J_16915 [Leptothrix sp. BB-4]
MSLADVCRSCQLVRRHHGRRAALRHLAHHLINRVVRVERLHLKWLPRERLKPQDTDAARRGAARLADADDLARMQADPAWDLSPEQMALAARGDRCMLSLLDGQPMGYLWVHEHGEVELLPGLVLRVPDHLLYVYAGLTLPEGRGHGLQSLRHAAVLAQPEWADRTGLLSYVRSINFSSRRGQRRSGFRRIGSIWVFGLRGGRLHCWFSPSLRRAGLAQVKNRDRDGAGHAPAA